MAQLPPGIDIKITPQPEQDGRGQGPHDKVRVGHIHEEHPDDSHGQGQHDSPTRAEFQRAVLSCMCIFHLFLHVSSFVDHQVIPCFHHSRFQGLGRTQRRVIGHSSRRGSIVHTGILDTGLAAQRLVHTSGTGRTTHSQYGENIFLRFHLSSFISQGKVSTHRPLPRYRIMESPYIIPSDLTLLSARERKGG